MSSISSLGSGNSYSPLQLLQQELTKEVSAGTVSSSDQSALSKALTDINQALTGGSSSSQSSNGQPPAPGSIHTKISSLIANEVSNGTLTSAQATELQNVFANAFAGGPGGAQGAGGPPFGSQQASGTSSASASAGSTGFTIEILLSSDGTSSTGSSSSTGTGFSLQDLLSAANSSSSSSSASGSASSSSTSSDVSNIIQDFLKLLQDSQSSASTYSAAGTSSNNPLSISALLINYQA